MLNCFNVKHTFLIKYLQGLNIIKSWNCKAMSLGKSSKQVVDVEVEDGDSHVRLPPVSPALLFDIYA